MTAVALHCYGQWSWHDYHLNFDTLLCWSVGALFRGLAVSSRYARPGARTHRVDLRLWKWRSYLLEVRPSKWRPVFPSFQLLTSMQRARWTADA